MPNSCGIYLIFNSVTRKYYVGSSSTTSGVEGRWKRHKTLLNLGMHHSKKLQRAWNKYPHSVWQWILHEPFPYSTPIKFILEREQFWIDFYNSARDGYNASPTAGNSSGFRHTKETKKKLSNARKGKGHPHTQESRDKISQANKGRPSMMVGIPKSKGTRKKISSALKGRKHSWHPTFTQEQLKAMSLRIGGSNNPNFGKPMSERIKSHLSLRNSGKGNPFFGKIHSELTRSRMREAWIRRRKQNG